MDDEASAYLAAHTAVVRPGLAFIEAIWKEQDLRAAWPLAHPTFRTCWVQQFFFPQLDRLAADGFDRDDLVEDMVADEPEHPLWGSFERGTVRNLLSWGDLAELGYTSNHRLVAPDVEVFYLIDTDQHGTEIPAYSSVPGRPVLMKYDDVWRVLSLSSDSVIPEPGWPPRLS
jgi:hypothetical protein